MNLKSGEIERFEEFSQFASLNEFNHHLEMWLSAYKHDLSKSELVGLKRLVRFSAKIPGVCNAKIGTVLKAIHEDYNDHGISRSTFKRMVQKAITLGIITVHETERKNGSQSSNLYVFNRFSNYEPPKQEKLNHPKETSIPSKTKDQKINKRTEESSNLDFNFVSDRVPQPFVQLVKVFFSEAKTIEEYWRMTQIAAYRNNFEKETEKVLVIAMAAFRQLIRKLKTTQVVRNQIAYFYGILDQKFEELFVKDLVEMEE
ncbi:hypothetical protein [Neobacillus massiliamazoniensis]|uniref:ABC transporter ATP-binding protein n=1 Tax=Neobacillus massiliamazoniensis TaxID=1499688 RepID=A0A0U1NQD3_9BACI|nr:hypothetical protein [Neobacillus massiliamazoniensis]CRK80195.1 ABC transporter ATP-binding protein [Neobacillus massiliamazoniensis]